MEEKEPVEASPKKEDAAVAAAAPKEDDETSADAKQGSSPSADDVPSVVPSNPKVVDLVDDKEEEEESHASSSKDNKAANKKYDSQPNDGELSNLSYPSPKNFAERMMNALESGLAAESIWWVGGGKAVALCPKKLRHSEHLTSYFRAKDYSGFIRNCNRWYVCYCR